MNKVRHIFLSRKICKKPKFLNKTVGKYGNGTAVAADYYTL